MPPEVMKSEAIMRSWNSARTWSFCSASTESSRAISKVRVSISSSRRCLKISEDISEPRETRKTAAFCLPAMSLTFLGRLDLEEGES